MNFNSLLTVLSSYWWSSNPAAEQIKTQQNRTTRRPVRSPPTGADFKRHSESINKPMYNDELQEVVQQNCGDFFSQQRGQTYNPIYSPAMSSSPATIVNQQQQKPRVIITPPVDCCSRTTTQMKKLESRLNSMENEVSALRQRLFKEETELDELQRSCSDHFNNQEQLDYHSLTVSAFSYPSSTVPFTPEFKQPFTERTFPEQSGNLINVWDNNFDVQDQWPAEECQPATSLSLTKIQFDSFNFLKNTSDYTLIP